MGFQDVGLDLLKWTVDVHVFLTRLKYGSARHTHRWIVGVVACQGFKVFF